MIVKGGFVHVAFALIKRITIKTDINTYDVGVKRCHTNCSVLRTSTILPNIRIS